MNEKALYKKTIRVILVFFIGLSFVVVGYKKPYFKEITVIIEKAEYLENFRLTHITFYRGRRASLKGEWVYIPSGNLRNQVLHYDRTKPPDPILEAGRVYLIRHTNTGLWRVIWIKEIGESVQ
jgi:hypothetical protein